MRYFLGFILACLIFAGSLGYGQDQAIPVGFIQLLATPEKFDGRIVVVLGFLVVEHQPKHAPDALLYLHEEDAKNLLPNCILVVPTAKMLQDQERINRMYVDLKGSFHAVRSVNGSYHVEINDVRSCTVWSDPTRPIGLKEDNPKAK